MKYATGEYIAFLDSDDYIDISLYEKMYNKAKERNYDYIECDWFSKKLIVRIKELLGLL